MKNYALVMAFIFVFSLSQCFLMQKTPTVFSVQKDSYEICMPSSETLLKEGVLSKEDVSKIPDHQNQTSNTCSPYYHYGWLLLFIIIICTGIIIIYRKAKTSKKKIF